MKNVKIRIPATTANLGGGYDLFGMALNLFNEATFEYVEQDHVECEVVGEGREILTVNESNLFLRSMNTFSKYFDEQIPGGILKMKNRIPLSRGLGSSSAAIVGGIYLANLLTGNKYVKEDLLPLAIELEGHPDNVAPALLGNFVVSIHHKGKWVPIIYDVPDDWSIIVSSPNIEVSTEAARRVLPEKILHHEAVENMSSVVSFVSAIVKNEPSYIERGFLDYLHIPYRLPLISNANKVFQAAMDSGAYGATISGSGSTLITIGAAMDADNIANAMQSAWGDDIVATTKVLSVCTQGVHEFFT